MQPAADDHFQLRVLEALASARNYNAWFADLALPYLGDDPVELGSGRGDHAALWLERGVPRFTVTDLDPVMLEALHARYDGDARVAVARLDLALAEPAGHTALVAFNVLEHIEDDVGALRAAKAQLRPGGRVVLVVPAFGFATSRFDHELGHFRRYRTATMRVALETAGLRVERLHYLNAPGLLAWTVGMKLLRQRPREGLALRAWDTGVIPLVRAVESRIRPPFGQSVFAVASA